MNDNLAWYISSAHDKKKRPFSRDNFTCEILQTSNFAGSRLKRVINVKKEILMNMLLFDYNVNAM